MDDKEKQYEPVLADEAEMIVTDYLLGEYELEKLKNGFLPPVIGGEPCPEHQVMFGIQETIE